MEMETWLQGILSKRTPDAVRILCDLIEAGLRKGECSANDVRDVSFEQPNIIGSVFRILPKFGFTHTDRREVTQRARKHKRRVDVWALDDTLKARQLVVHLKGFLLLKESAQPAQQQLL